MRATEESNGGLKRKALKSVVEARLLGTPIGSSGGGFFPHELDFVLPTQNAAVSVQAGRAWMNNGALLAVLAAAAQPNIEWLLCLVPFTYMNAAQFDPVVAQIEALAVSDGVDLDLRGIIVIAY